MPCRQQRRALAELRAKDEKFEASGRQQLLRGALRSITAECSEALRKVEDKLLSVREEARKQAHSRFRPLVVAAEEKCKKMAQELALEKKARVAAEQRATAAEELASKLADQLDLEQDAYKTKANDASMAKKQKRERSVQVRTLTQERDDLTAALLEQERLAAVAAAATAAAVTVAEVERGRADAADDKTATAIDKLSKEMTGKIEEARCQTIAARESVEAVVRKGPKSYSEEELNTLSFAAEKQARYRERKFFRWLLGGRQWRVTNIAAVMKEMNWIEELMLTPEGQEWFMLELRELTGNLEGVHFGINFGLWMHLDEKCPKRFIRRLRQAGSEKYDHHADKYKRKPWYVNPCNENDVVYVPFCAPAPTALDDDLEEYGQMHGLHSSTDGSCAVQNVEELIPYVITRDHFRQPPFSVIGNNYEILLQGDGARRGIKAFAQWVFKNPYVDSQSCSLLHLLALGVGVKDNKVREICDIRTEEICDIRTSPHYPTKPLLTILSY